VLVDNRKPDVVGLTVRYPWATGIARDATSTVDGIEYAIDGGPWRLISVVDGIYDSTAEAFRIALPADLARGGHTLAVRARDAGGNLGVRQVRFVR